MVKCLRQGEGRDGAALCHESGFAWAPRALASYESAMLVCVDVDYRPAVVSTACVGISAWAAADVVYEARFESECLAAPYLPGEFYRRELPHIVAALERVPGPITAVIVDGYAWLGGGRAGLGARLHRTRGEREPIIGVAKTPFRGGDAVPVLRGRSRRPLYVTAAGMDAHAAAAAVQSMHGAHRIPTALKRVDRLARGLVAGAPRSRS
jgi:deoxyribonuclease V